MGKLTFRCICACLGGLAASGAEVNSALSIRPAVELEFHAEAGRSYQVQSSANLADWTRVESFIVGSGRSEQRFASARENQSFVRLEVSTMRDFKTKLEEIRVAAGVPALGAAVVRSNQLVGLAVTGFRKWKEPEAATAEDKWHHGSITKSMTATLAAILVEEGKLRWTTTVSEVFPEYSAGMHANWRGVSLDLLLGHRAGAPGDLNANGLWGRLWNHGGRPEDQRLMLLTNVTAVAPASEPGTRYTYSNAGYAIAGAMIEKVIGQPWEEVIRRRLFEPLGMSSAGFGVPATPRYLDQPWGHVFNSSGVPSPIEPGPNADNPAAIGPGGTVHSTLVDLAKFVALHVAGERGKAHLLSAESFRKLHTALPGQDYALGWSVGTRTWAGGKTLNHTGSNTMWYTNVWLAPEKDFAMIIVTNIGGDQAFAVTDQVAGELIKLFL